jgi:adenine-specific DNA-methyltransferase
MEPPLSLPNGSPIGGEPEPLETFDMSANADAPANAEAYLDKMIRILRNDGVRFPDNKVMKFTSLAPLSGNADWLHAEGEWVSADNSESPRRVAVSFGPQYGPVTTMQVEECIRVASLRGYNDLVFAGFSFDGAAQAAIQADPNPRVRIHLAHICPDVNANSEGLLKDTRDGQLFTVFGLPRTELRQTEGGEWLAEMQGVDIYNPVDNTIVPTGADKVAAWFVDSDYDGRTFCICQAFFPDRSAWDRLARALKGVIDEDKFAAFSGTVSLPFPVGKHKRAAVKVIDPRGNEVMRVHSLEEVARYG